MPLPHASLVLLGLVLATESLQAQDLANTCHASSSYDLTLESNGLLFDRAEPTPRQVQLDRGSLRVDGRPVRVSMEDQDRLTLFERDLRALVPRVRTVADHGVDLAVRALREEAAGMGLGADTRVQLDQRLQADAATLKQRIASSRSTHDWDGAAAQQVANQLVGDLAPLVAGDLGQQAITAALAGAMQTAGELRARAAGLATGRPPRLLQRMQALRPEIQALCPAIRQLAELQQGVLDADGRPLDLLQVTP